MRAAVAIVLLLAACAFVVSWWNGTVVAPSTNAATSFGEPAVESRPGTPASEVAVRAPIEASANAVAAAIPENATWVDVRVVDVITKAPVAAADVWWKDATSDARVDALPRDKSGAFYADQELVARTFGWHALTDERGVARVHTHPAGASVFARSGDRFGESSADPFDAARGIELAIEKDLELVVRVVDALGRPAVGVPVGMGTETYSSGPRADTDAEGEARFRHLQAELERDEGGAPIDEELRVSVRIAGLKEQCAAVVSALTLPKAPVTLTLPSTGELHVRVLHPGRAVEWIGARFWIGAADDTDAYNDASYRTSDGEGLVRFPYVPVGQMLAVHAEVGRLGLHQAVLGPAVAGQVAFATFEVPKHAIALVGRILAADGRPIVADGWVDRLDATLSTSTESGGATISTDALGRFVMHVRASHDPEEPMELSGFHVSYRRGPFDTLRAAVAARMLEPGVNDLGDIRLDAAPLLVAGRARFDRSPEYRRVPFRVERWVDGDAGSGGRWQVEDDLFEERDYEGRFAVRGRTWPGRLRLDFAPYGPPIEFERGTKHLPVNLVCGHSLTVCCEVSGFVWGKDLEYSLHRAGDPDGEFVGFESGWYGGAQVHAHGLAAGAYTLRVRLVGSDEVLANEPGIVLPTAEGAFERRIDVDLSTRVDVLQLRLTEAGGGRIESAVFAFVDQTVELGLHRGYELLGPNIHVPILRRPVDLTIVGPAWRPLHLRGVTGTVEAVLERWPTVPIKIEGIPKLARREVRLTVAGGGSRDDPVPVRIGTAGVDLHRLLGSTSTWHWLEPDEAFEIRAAEFERRVTATLQTTSGLQPLRFTPTVIPAGTAPVTIRFDPDEIRRAIDPARAK